ncbi:threonine dehydrogenase-like Zn-dependent dehydrogenase [Nocardia transvalensis]|uniref:Threonine dehydrogenase-like Zn-dependent dehydrogenase n=1 Tax=Nocardia transvalensis TaxID=37333 RepID=A0A7W9PEC5_9NOCA|nr:zinc-binding dehydrogenase [Nocardia transvalensis]MBB5914108.1 threonine dehydrogenase-like Zn-dependent dehydrogenase [Nocardia transvalensis]
MKAVVCSEGKLEVAEVAAPRPGPGQVLISVSRCGICGSDLHARVHCDDLADLAATTGYDNFMRSDQRVVLGHEFCGEVVEYGPGCRKRWRPGTKVVALPILRNGREPELTGLSEAAPGGYAEQVVVQESMTFPVPNGLSDEHAALTEPMAVAWHAVRRGRVGKGRTAYVIGCGPIGLAVISMLRAAGVKTIVASDFSPRRRELATRCGADVVVDPAADSPWTAAPKKSRVTGVTDVLNLGFDAMERLRRLPNLPWWYAFRLAHTLNAGPSGPVIFECVGVPGIIDQILTAAPPMSRVVVVGVCMEADRIRPAVAINKEIDLRFAFGYDPGEFRDTLHMIADGKVDPSPLITGTVGLAGVDNAFTALANPEQHAKILIDPTSPAIEP